MYLRLLKNPMTHRIEKIAKIERKRI